MRKLSDVLRLKYSAKLSNRQIARALRLAHSTVGEYLRRFEESALAWPLPEDLEEAVLWQRLFPEECTPSTERPLPDWSQIQQELRRKGVTLMLLWQEYKERHPDGLQYSRFCERYRTWQKTIDLVMRQEHRAGEKLFVDYAGQTVAVIDPATGEPRAAQIFVATLGASNYTFAEASWTQSLPDWIASHQRAFHFFGGVPEIVVPDNLKSGVAGAHRYEPDLNPTYQDLASHYAVAVLPTRVRAPKDKAKVEAGVLLVERWILARLRRRTFFSLEELNAAIAHLVERLNEHPFKKLDGSRKSMFLSLEQPLLRALPKSPYVFAEWKKARVHIDYHVEIDGHYYSVPHQYARQQVEVRLTQTTIECFFQGRRIAAHARSSSKGYHTTVKNHMPKQHRYWADWTPERIVEWAQKTGPATAALIEQVIASRAHPQQGYRSCLGILRLGEAHGRDRLEAAAERALALRSYSYRSIASMLKHGLEQQQIDLEAVTPHPITHENLRGAAYYAQTTENNHHIDTNRRYEC